MNWTPCKIESNYIPALGGCERARYLVTLEKSTGIRFVWVITVDNGLIDGDYPGKVIAWAPMPAPYAG